MMPDAPRKIPGTLPAPDPLAALQAIALAASDPQAMQAVIAERQAQTRARESEILQAQRINANEEAQVADREFRRSENEKTRTGVDRRAKDTLDLNRKRLEVSESQFAVGQEADATAAGRLKVHRDRVIEQQKRTQDRLDRTQYGKAIKDTRARIAGSEAGLNAGLPEGAKPISLKDVFAVPGLGQTLASALLRAATGPDEASAGPDEVSRQAAARNAKAILLTVQGADLALIAQQQSGGAETADSLAEQSINTILAGMQNVAPELQEQFVKDLTLEMSALNSAREKLARNAAETMTTEDNLAYIDDSARALLAAVVSGDEFSVAEQRIFANWWAKQKDKQASLQVIIAGMADKAANEGGFDDDKRALLNNSVFASLNAMISGDDFEFTSIPLPRQDDAKLRNINIELRAAKKTQQEAIRGTSLEAALNVKQTEERIQELEREFLEREAAIARQQIRIKQHAVGGPRRIGAGRN